VNSYGNYFDPMFVERNFLVAPTCLCRHPPARWGTPGRHNTDSTIHGTKESMEMSHVMEYWDVVESTHSTWERMHKRRVKVVASEATGFEK
jgi:hypothetical protein